MTVLLRAWSSGEERAREALIAMVYGQLRSIARRQLRRERHNHTLQPTAVVHEAYARLMAHDPIAWQDRRHFFAVITRAMRHVLVDHARARLAGKRDGGVIEGWDDVATEVGLVRAPELLAIDEALTQLAAIDPHKAQLVQLRFFGGLSLEETAELLGCSRATVVRDWRMARAWLFRELGR
ncbi:sigma-70 family RNA polymerase sigma factor [Nannocystis bainbridge]|uniref:Sigma-70 family RNA polymerase sigma factor n=1 Tax=Nannocystis bainbridge TaxID=2995303 RepID=A0ABT5DV38_9BACT|nr:sigma-70 family RNA polymerase sigma factor [Nannocystis bainbridge]MDC0716583.1 sigma-70 family RNA polymerase sigma factor [Nannocystis bainbridge]